MLLCAVTLIVSAVSVCVELYLKLKNNGTRTINAIELNGSRK